MSGYRKQLKIEGIVVDGVAHTFTVRPMNFEQSMDVYDSVKLVKQSDDPRVMARRERAAFRNAARKFIAKEVVSIEPPIKDADGGEVSAEEFFHVAYFTSPAVDVCEAWVAASFPLDPTLPVESSDDGHKDSQSSTTIPSSEAGV